MKEFIDIVKKYENFISTQPKWESRNSNNLKLQNEIRAFLKKKQLDNNNRILCVYCKREIEIHSKSIIDEHIEHILLKSKYRELTYAPYNLALACRACNYNKDKVDIIGNVTLPTREFNFNNLLDENFLRNKKEIGEYYNIIHPYYDDYYENIEIDNNCAYNIRENAPNYEGAKNMIEICKLMEIAEIERNKRNYIIRKFLDELGLNDLGLISKQNGDKIEIKIEIEIEKYKDIMSKYDLYT